MMSRFFTIGLLACVLSALSAVSGFALQAGQVRVLTVQSSINPVVAEFVREQISLANEQADAALLLQLDTPGGLDTAMREIVQAELQSLTPVIVHVAPSGARAASAGALIALAADFVVMAPGTNIGAAHPVSIGAGGIGSDPVMAEKVVNDAVAYSRSLAQQKGRNQDWAERIVRDSLSTPAQEALELQVVDMIADDVSALLEGLHGRKYLRQGQVMSLDVASATLLPVEMTWRQSVLNAISHPNVAYLLMMLGMLGIFFELSQPGVILPGVIGAIALLLAFFALQTLPVNFVGVLLILLSLVLFVLEIKVVSYGMLSVGGIVAMSIGSLMLIDSSDPYMQISRAVIAATVSCSAAFFLLATWMVVRTQRRRFFSGTEGMIGETGMAVSDIGEDGKVFVHGEYWQATSQDRIAAGTRIEVTAVADGLVLKVRGLEKAESSVAQREEED
ncbi:MAG: nodulation protein NfeD [Desulfuromonadales bacterium]|nr:nodulation protein NfeD [Desulfuromonadales bacterium]